MEEKSKLQLIGEIAQANNKNLELIEEINEKEDEIERLNKEIESWIKLIDYKGIEDIPQYVSDLEVDNKQLKEENQLLNKNYNIINELERRFNQELENNEKWDIEDTKQFYSKKWYKDTLNDFKNMIKN